jgi:hypothetical protein
MFTEIYLLIKWVIYISKKKAETSKKPPMDFCSLMLSVFSTPSCSTSLERIFNTWTNLRNRLDPEKANELNKVYHFLEDINPTDRLVWR